ncbi:T9SS type A sorting domain-containing protein [bacterium SCSIO 12741]|nr:T9SS type A sorting domain-containing protein [bacterium SCSIO 12741]
MKSIITAALLLLLSGAIYSQSLLKNPQTGNPIGTGTIDQIKLITDGQEVVLIVADGVKFKLYAIALNDNNVADRHQNLVDSIPNYTTKISAALGVGSVHVMNMEVNPLSGSVYFLVNDGAQRRVMVATNGGNDLQILDLSQVTYCEMSYSNNGFTVQDITWGNGTLYVSSGELFGGLVGEVAAVNAPFEHQTQVVRRATTLYKTNWGGGYHTNAPLEKMAYTEINGQSRLMGVTVCAPGFSFDPATINGAGVLQVHEQFNVHNNLPSKVVAVNQDGMHYLYNLHRDNGINNQVLMRIGQHWIDGTPENNNQINNNAVRLRDNAGQPATGMTDSDIKVYPETYRTISFYDNHNLLVLTSDATLKMLKVGTKDPVFTLNAQAIQQPIDGVRVYPNPVSDRLEVAWPGSDAQVELMDLKGRVLQSESQVSGGNIQFSLKEYPAGQYIVRISAENRTPYTTQIIKK